MADLKTTYKDDILDISQNTNRKFQMTNNSDGTVSFTDKTVYSINGDSYGAAEINEQNKVINSLKKTVDEFELDAEHISFNDTTAQTGSTNVQGAIESLKSAFSKALADLKATAIAQAVGATGTTFASVIEKLATIVNRGKVTQSLNTSTTRYTIPAGYHDGTGTVSLTTETKSVGWSTSAQTVTPSNGKVLSKVSVGATPDARTSSQVGTLTSADGRRVHSLREIWRVTNSDNVVRTCFELPATGYYENTDIVAATDAQLKTLGWVLDSDRHVVCRYNATQNLNNNTKTRTLYPNGSCTEIFLVWAEADYASGNTSISCSAASSITNVANYNILNNENGFEGGFRCVELVGNFTSSTGITMTFVGGQYSNAIPTLMLCNK